MKNGEQNLICEETQKVCMTVREAGMVLNLFKRHHHMRAKKDKIPKRKYLCKYCGYYHLTHMASYDDGTAAKLKESKFFTEETIERNGFATA